MAHGQRTGGGQLQFNWTWAQRREWITQAELVGGVAADGRPVSARSMAALLHAINDHLGNNVEAWPSQERLAAILKVSTKTIKRSCDALASKSLLIVDARPCSSGTRNYYRIVWSELQLLQPARRAAWDAILRADAGDLQEEEELQRLATYHPSAALAGAPAGPSDTTPEPSDILREPSDTVSRPSDTMSEPSDTVSTEYYRRPQEDTTTTLLTGRQPECEPDHAAEPHTAVETARTWPVVVSECLLLGLSQTGARRAAQAARQRGLTPEAAWQLVELYRQRASRHSDSTGGRRITPGWLYRWLTGESVPEEESTHPAAAGSDQRGDAMTREQVALVSLRSRIVRCGRQAGWSEEHIAARCAAAGVPYD